MDKTLITNNFYNFYICPKKRSRAEERTERKMKKIWMKRLTAVSLMMAVGIGTGIPLRAQEEEIAGKTGGGDL